MLRPLISFKDLVQRHGHRAALQVLRQMEEHARIKSGAVVSFDLEARFTAALRRLQAQQMAA